MSIATCNTADVMTTLVEPFRPGADVFEIATCNTADVMTTPRLAAAVPVAEWALRAAIRRGFIAPPMKIGPTWAWAAEDLDRVRRGLREAGYLPAETASGAPA